MKHFGVSHQRMLLESVSSRLEKQCIIKSAHGKRRAN